MADKVVYLGGYLGGFLTEFGKNTLLARFGTPAHKRVYADHVTLAFNPGEEEMAKFKAFDKSKPRLIHIIGYMRDDKGEAALVRLADLPFCTNSNPHITLSCAEGVPPSYSNSMLSTHDVKKMRLVTTGEQLFVYQFEPFEVEVIYDTFPRTQQLSHSPSV
jgi:hypothetical protein